MERTFHRRVDAYGVAAAILPAAVSLMLFLHHTPGAVVAGLAMMLLTVIVIERLIHSTYTFTADNTLLIYSGRFSQTKTIRLGEVVRATRVSGRLLNQPHIIIRFGAGHTTSVQPENEDAFYTFLMKKVNETYADND